MPFTVYRSSAGSGKTFTLVKEYLRLVLPDPGRFRHILAITFTNKVANEMKERIILALKDLSRKEEYGNPGPAAVLHSILVRETGLSVAEIRERSSLVLREILHNYSDFSICTIDSFSHRIIRTFAHDFGLPVNFNVELDSEELLRTAVALLLEDVGEDEDLTRLLLRFLESRLDEERSTDVEEALVRFADALFKEEGAHRVEKLKHLTVRDFDNIVARIHSIKSSFEQKISEIASQAIIRIRSEGIPPEAFYYGSKGIHTYFLKLLQPGPDCLEPNRYVEKTIREGVWSGGKATPDDRKKITEVSEFLQGCFEAIEKERSKGGQLYVFLVLLLRSVYPLAVLCEIDKKLSEYKRENNLVHISEFNGRISGIVMNEPVPFIYERLGERYKHILIDEFQDTSRLQWTNLQPLVENALSNGYDNMVVGDAKQAIYRWRNGDVKQFTLLPSLPGSNENRVTGEREKVFHDHFEYRGLDWNYRSRKEIVELNNRFFSYVGKVLGGEAGRIYENPGQKIPDDREGGYVRIEFLERSDGERTYVQQTMDRCLEIIHDLLERKCRLRDMAILCRKNRDASELARFLLANGIRVISGESLLLCHSPEINFIIRWIRLLYEQDNPLLKGEVLAFLKQTNRLGNAGLHELLSGNTGNRDEEVRKSFVVKLSDGREITPGDSWEGLPVYDLCEEIIRRFSLNREPDPYLQFFLDRVYSFSRRSSTSPHAFLEWWEENGEGLSIVVPEGMDAVRILSIHKAKGLQFPVVIFPFAHDHKKASKDYLWIDVNGEPLGLPVAMVDAAPKLEKTIYSESWLEEDQNSRIDLANLLYVSMTRAEEMLFLLTRVPPAKSETVSIPALFKGFLEETGSWSEEKCIYSFGDYPADRDVKKEEGIPAVSPGKFISTGWQERITIRARAPERWNLDDPERNAGRGNLLHTILSRVRSRDDIIPVLEEVWSRGVITTSEKEELAGTLRSVTDHPVLSPYFEQGSDLRTETDLLLPDGSVLRPDRVVMAGGKAVIIDYKTGTEKESHAIQLNTYEKCLIDMGFSGTRKLIVYTEPEVKVVEL